MFVLTIEFLIVVYFIQIAFFIFVQFNDFTFVQLVNMFSVKCRPVLSISRLIIPMEK